MRRALFGLTVAAAMSGAALEVYVDAAAAAGGDGTAARPLATAQAARDAVRTARKAGKVGPRETVTVTFAPGDYPQLTPFELSPADSGSCDYAPIVWRAATPRTVRFTGGVALKAKDFAKVSDPAILGLVPEEGRDKVRVADVSGVIQKVLPDLPHDFTGVPPPPVVFMRGRVTECARWPNAGDYAQFYGKDKVDDRAFCFDNPRAKRWNLKRGVWLNGYWTHDWSQNVTRVDRFGPEDVKGADGKTVRRENVIRFDTMKGYGVMRGTYGGHKGRRFYAMNLLEELDAPGEWYYDRAAKKLYVIPLDGVDVRDADDVVMAINNDVVFRVAADTKHVRLEGLDFTGTAGNLMTFLVQDGVIADCRFSCCGRTGLSLGGPTRRVRVTDCEFAMIGGTGIGVGAGNLRTLTRGDVVIENCRIHDFGQFNRTYNGAVALSGVGNTLRKCEIWNAPHLAIASGGANNLVEYNNIHHVLLETADAGAYYSGRNLLRQGTVLRYNYFHDLGRIDGSCVAIYYDDCGCGEAAYGNIIHRAGLAFLVGGGRDHPIRGNIISSCLSGISLNSRGMSWPVFNDPNARARKGGDRSHRLHENAQRVVDYETGAWLDAFPRNANVMNDDWAMPYYDPVENNIFIDVKRSIIGVSSGDHFNVDRMAPIAGNLIVSTTGAKGIATNVPASVAAGFKTLVGTPEKPIDPGVDDLAAGDFRFLPESVLLKECPGFDVIPFDEIPNVSGERPLTDYAALVRVAKEGKVWTAALQKALDENARVRIPPSAETYFIDAPVIVPSGRRINAHGAKISLLPGCNTLMLRNACARDGEALPIPADAPRDRDISITGGTWCDWRSGRAGYGRSGMFNLEPRKIGNFFGVSTLFYFGCVDGLSITSVKFSHCAAFAVQCGDAKNLTFRHIRFDRCYADGLHLNGNIERVRGYDIKGCVGDDLVALNAYDWKNSSVNFGPQKDLVFEDIELIRPAQGGYYPAIRILPAVYRYEDGKEVDCAISDVTFRKVRGVKNFKMYAQTPGFPIGTKGEWYKVGSGGNILFEDVEVDLTSPIDMIGDYVNQDPVRGHIAAFEFGANLSKVTFRDVTVNFHCDTWKLSHLALVGPKSCRRLPKKPGDKTYEVFDPDLTCTVDEVVLDNVRVRGVGPKELVRATVFDNINGDGNSTGKGTIRKLTVLPRRPVAAACPRHALNNRHRTASGQERKFARTWTEKTRAAVQARFTVAPADALLKIDVKTALPAGADAKHPVPVFIVGDVGAAEFAAGATALPVATITGRGYGVVTWRLAAPVPAGVAALDARMQAYAKAVDAVASNPAFDIKRMALVGAGASAEAALRAAVQGNCGALVIAHALDTGAVRTSRGAGKAEIADLFRLVAPHRLYVSDVEENPQAKDTYEELVRAEGLWRGLGGKGLALTTRWSNVYPEMTDHSGSVAYHLRWGKPALATFDWDRYLDYADLVWPVTEGTPTPARMP